LAALLPAYAAGSRGRLPDLAALHEQIARVRAWRLRDFLAKTVRDCTLFAVEQTSPASARCCARRPKRWRRCWRAGRRISAGRSLKDGGTCTVASVLVDEPCC
jgi:hypothetical protein